MVEVRKLCLPSIRIKYNVIWYFFYSSIYIEKGEGDPYGPLWNAGDIIGCGISSISHCQANVYFTYNGKKVLTIYVNVLLKLILAIHIALYTYSFSKDLIYDRPFYILLDS